MFNTVKKTNGYILKHGVMRENASSVFNGIGYIKHGGTKSIANQESRVLMLSENARGDANPILLIDEDDVEGHTRRLLAELTLSNFTT